MSSNALKSATTFEDLVTSLSTNTSIAYWKVEEAIDRLVDDNELPTTKDLLMLSQLTTTTKYWDLLHKALLMHDKYICDLVAHDDAKAFAQAATEDQLLKNVGFSFLLKNAINSNIPIEELGYQLYETDKKIIIQYEELIDTRLKKLFERIANLQDNIVKTQDDIGAEQALLSVLGIHTFYQCKSKELGHRLQVNEKDLQERLSYLHSQGMFTQCNVDDLVQVCDAQKISTSCFDTDSNTTRIKRVKLPTNSIWARIVERRNQDTTTDQGCVAKVRTCLSAASREELEKYKEQEADAWLDFVYHPLKHGCPSDQLDSTLYVIASRKMSRTKRELCGSLRCTLHVNKKYAYVDFLVTRAHSRPEVYKGTGYKLLDALVTYLRKNYPELSFLCLNTVSDAFGFYIKYGFINLFASSHLMFLDLTSDNNDLFYNLRYFIDHGVYALPSDISDYQIERNVFAALKDLLSSLKPKDVEILHLEEYISQLIEVTPIEHLSAVINAFIYATYMNRDMFVSIMTALKHREKAIERYNAFNMSQSTESSDSSERTAIPSSPFSLGSSTPSSSSESSDDSSELPKLPLFPKSPEPGSSWSPIPWSPSS